MSRYFATFAVRSGPSEMRLDAALAVRIVWGPGPGRFGVVSDGTKIDNPRFLPRAEEREQEA
ncbi:hypothetical protein PV350_13550 [Streptomyces sp. PA03-6a]|nr:hypothetical protein [Streptomyces sp. PA03-6a]